MNLDGAGARDPMSNTTIDKRNPISEALAKPIRSILSDLGSLGLQELIEVIAADNKILQKIPFADWAITVGSAYSAVQTAFFIKKYARFIAPIGNALDDQWDPGEVEKLLGSEKEHRKLIEQTIIALDRYQTELKATLLGELYVQTFRYRHFSVDEHNYLSFSIELIHPYSGLPSLRDFYEYRVAMDEASTQDERTKIWEHSSKADFSPLVHTGLLTLPVGASVVGDLGGAHLNELGRRFYHYVVRPHEGDMGVASNRTEGTLYDSEPGAC